MLKRFVNVFVKIESIQRYHRSDSAVEYARRRGKELDELSENLIRNIVLE